MARNKKFWTGWRNRKYQPRDGGPEQSRKVPVAKWVGPDGRVRTCDCSTQTEALEVAEREWLAVHGGTAVKKSAPTVNHSIQDWLANLEQRHEMTLKGLLVGKHSVSGAYLKAMKLLAETVLSPMFGAMKPGAIDKPLIERWARDVTLDGTMTPGEVKYAVARLRLVLDQAVAKGYTAINRARVQLDLPYVEPTNVIVPEDEDIVAMLKYLEPDMCPLGDSEILWSAMRMAIYFVASGGLRPKKRARCGMRTSISTGGRCTSIADSRTRKATSCAARPVPPIG
jgi:hypothetical protein